MCSSISDRLVHNVSTGEVKQQDELERITGELRSHSRTVTLPLSEEIEILKAILTCVFLQLLSGLLIFVFIYLSHEYTHRRCHLSLQKYQKHS